MEYDDIKPNGAPAPVAPEPPRELHKRLKYLIDQSGVYVNIIADKLEKEREEAKVNAEKVAKVQTKKTAPTTTATETATTGRSRRNGAAAPKAAPATKKKRGRPAKNAKATISDYFGAEDLDVENTTKTATEALADAANEDVQIGAQAGLQSARQPAMVTGGVMKDYQLEGLYWLVSLYENGLNGILADEMGLGKTLQTISFLAYLQEKGVWGPFLIAAPVSTLSNWMDEIERFAPGMSAVMYHGAPAERQELRETRLNHDKQGPGFPVVCTSYDIIMRDRKFLQKFSWKYIIIDEGHRIKNLDCKLIKELKSYDSANRLLLTGTPLQNNLAELWSLLNFLLPEVFDDLYFFQQYFNFENVQTKDHEVHAKFIEEEKKMNLVGSLHALLKPFLLRRVKTDVMSSLPPKREYILYAPLTQTQKDLYEKLLNHDARDWLVEKIIACSGVKDVNNTRKRKLLELEVRSPTSNEKKNTAAEVDSPRFMKTRKTVSYRETTDEEYFKTAFASDESRATTPVELDEYEQTVSTATRQVNSKKLQNLIMQLRQTCNSPHLFYWPWQSGGDPDNTLITESGKMMLLERLVPELFKRDHKVLIFSQFSSMLDIIETWATDLHDWPVCRIDGKVSQDDRREQIKSFNTNPEFKLFLLSTRAGGLGINLTSSDTVILFDSDWNPQVDLQAQDRAHRIGQTKPVVVYRLATAATVEQTLLDKADGKRRLEKLIIQKGKFKDLRAADKGDGENDEQLSEILLKEDFQKVNVVQEGQQVLTDKELEQLLDRSEEAFKNKDNAGAAIKVV